MCKLLLKFVYSMAAESREQGVMSRSKVLISPLWLVKPITLRSHRSIYRGKNQNGEAHIVLSQHYKYKEKYILQVIEGTTRYIGHSFQLLTWNKPDCNVGSEKGLIQKNWIYRPFNSENPIKMYVFFFNFFLKILQCKHILG